VQGCITMVSLETGSACLTWNDYQEKVALGEMGPIPAHP
ncbi:MAG: hypothetical protein QOG92_2261, partial [Verrucomicrobiota bacterium]|nr:hypothetical protein [Verrucomicrobiota bacterium]